MPAFHERLHPVFAGALAEAGFVSWVGGNHAATTWLVGKWGDVYLHETVISRVRRLLETQFMCTRTHETVSQFRLRMERVSSYMNSEAFTAGDGRCLEGLSRDLCSRCLEVVRLRGERLPK